MFVCGIVIANDVDLFVRRRIALDQIEEANPFLMTMSGHAGFQDGSIERVECSEEGGCAVAFVVVGHCPATPFLHGKSELSRPNACI